LPDFYYVEYTGVPIVLRIAFPLFLIFLIYYLKKVNNVDKPSGVWLAWKRHNDMLKEWWLENYPK
jgi:hypothetical protein